MIQDFLTDKIREELGFTPTPDQQKALQMMVEFMYDRNPHALFILKGYAGTGKTSLLSAIVKAFRKLKQRFVLMAPTGRAAKNFSLLADYPAYTIHKRIYREEAFGEEAFIINNNLTPRTLFIIDEASMIYNENAGNSMFGTGRLLNDLLGYVYSAQGCKLIFSGDTAQLPPVGEEESPALSATVLERYGFKVWEAELTRVVRQKDTSGILSNATRLRQLIANEECFELPKFKLSPFEDIHQLPGDELIETLENCYGQDGTDDTMIVCRSNKRANLYNNGIRNQILGREEELSSGDRILIVKNNYYWPERNQCKEVKFIANGDMAVVRRIRNIRDLYGFHFADATLTFPDYNDCEMDVTVLLDTLRSDAPALTKEQNDRFYRGIFEDYADIPQKKERIKSLKADIYYNALQIKYGYAVTCHKAQGGQWKNVFLDQGYMTDDMITPDYFRWLYTAMTRASRQLYLVNWPDEQITSD